MRRGASGERLRLGRAAALASLLALLGSHAAATCGDKPVYLTFDTGHMGVAPLVADVLQREGIKVTFFLANERTLEGGTSLDERWAPWWRARAAEGHAFGSHLWDHDVWLADVKDARDPRATKAGRHVRVRPTQGAVPGKVRVFDAAGYCRELARPAERLAQLTGGSARMGSLFRAPGGKTSPLLLEMAASCGWTHVGWSAAGFLGDELPSDRFSNAWLLQRALRDIGPGDILLAHLGIWSRQDPWAPVVLEPLVRGLKQRGFCFATLREHPAYSAAAAALR